VFARARILLPLALLLVLAGAPAAARADAQQYVGNGQFLSDLGATVDAGRITHFMGYVITTCPGARAFNGFQSVEGDEPENNPDDVEWKIETDGPFDIVDGHFHFTVPAASGDSLGATMITVDGDLRDGVLIGTLSADRDGASDGVACAKSGPFEAGPAPRQGSTAPKPNFDGSALELSYTQGRITDLVVHATATCEDEAGQLRAVRWSSWVNNIDSIGVDAGGHFEIESTGTGLNSPADVVHVVVRGRIEGRRATGTLTVGGRALDQTDTVVNCRGDQSWTAYADLPPVVDTAPWANYTVLPMRSGRGGTYAYYLRVTVESCAYAQKALVKLAGRQRLVRCGRRVLIGPLTSRHVYKLSVTPLKVHGRRILRRGAVSADRVYLPGEDGYWVPTNDF
jgi:hypothetical protein